MWNKTENYYHITDIVKLDHSFVFRSHVRDMIIDMMVIPETFLNIDMKSSLCKNINHKEITWPCFHRYRTMSFRAFWCTRVHCCSGNTQIGRSGHQTPEDTPNTVYRLETKTMIHIDVPQTLYIQARNQKKINYQTMYSKQVFLRSWFPNLI